MSAEPEVPVADLPGGPFGRPGELLRYIRADFRANPRDSKVRLLLALFRVAQCAMVRRESPALLSWPVIFAYRLVSEVLGAFELRPKTRVGPGLTVFHGFGMVLNDHAMIGSQVTLRNGAVIGNVTGRSGCPVVGDRVEVGANAVILGDITIGVGAIIGAGAVVTKDVPAFGVVVGNPARLLRVDAEGSR